VVSLLADPARCRSPESTVAVVPGQVLTVYREQTGEISSVFLLELVRYESYGDNAEDIVFYFC